MAEQKKKLAKRPERLLGLAAALFFLAAGICFFAGGETRSVLIYVSLGWVFLALSYQKRRVPGKKKP